MASLKDTIKAALEKKQAEQHASNSKVAIDTKGQKAKSQVNVNKPTKKSAGRGR
jgi:hypothetical protein